RAVKSTSGKGKMSKRIISFASLLAAVFAIAFQARAQVPGPLKLAQTIPLPGLKDGDFDHFALDAAGQRLFLAAEENSAVLVISLRTNKVLQSLQGPKAPHSFAFAVD